MEIKTICLKLHNSICLQRKKIKVMEIFYIYIYSNTKMNTKYLQKQITYISINKIKIVT